MFEITSKIRGNSCQHPNRYGILIEETNIVFIVKET